MPLLTPYHVDRTNSLFWPIRVASVWRLACESGWKVQNKASWMEVYLTLADTKQLKLAKKNKKIKNKNTRTQTHTNHTHTNIVKISKGAILWVL